MKNMLQQVTVIFVTFVLLIGLPIIGGLVANQFSYSSIDQDGSYMWISIHHIVQALLIVPFMLLIKKIWPNSNLGLHKGNVRLGLKYIGMFTLVFIGYTVVGYVIVLTTQTFQSFQFPMNLRNVVGYLGFQLLLSGPSEEFLFRSFGVVLLSVFISKRLFKNRVSLANIIVAIIFGLAHIAIIWSPFELRYSLVQVIYAIILGLVYGDCFEKTGSVLYPMALHSISNVISVGVTIIITTIMN